MIFGWGILQVIQSSLFVGRKYHVPKFPQSVLSYISAARVYARFVLLEDVIVGPAGAGAIAPSACARPDLLGATWQRPPTLLTASWSAPTVVDAIVRRGDANAWMGSPELLANEATVRGAVLDTVTVGVCLTMLKTTAATNPSSTSTMT